MTLIPFPKSDGAPCGRDVAVIDGNVVPFSPYPYYTNKRLYAHAGVDLHFSLRYNLDSDLDTPIALGSLYIEQETSFLFSLIYIF